MHPPATTEHVEEPVVTANIVLASLLKSLTVLSLNTTITESLLAVGRPIGT
jgi:hypothetical protein